MDKANTRHSRNKKRKNNQMFRHQKKKKKKKRRKRMMRTEGDEGRRIERERGRRK